MTEKLFKHRKANREKLSAYGFTERKDGLFYSLYLEECRMTLNVTVDKAGRVGISVFDNTSDEEYYLYLVKNASGTFVGNVRRHIEEVLKDISDRCFDEEIFKAKQTKQVIEYFRSKYGNELEHLWESAPDNAIVRRADNGKWYAAILTVSRNKLGFDSDERVEIIDLHAKSDEIPSIVDNVRYFPGFHMNKKHWITVILDGTVPNIELFERIDESYALGKK